MNELKIRTVIIDDEPHCRSALAKQLEWSCPMIEVVGFAANSFEGKSVLQHQSPHLVFLDIEMPDQNGFDLLSSFDNADFEVIFTTAYDEYALQAFKAHAIDYLVKPIDEEALIEAVDRAMIFIINSSFSNQPILNQQSMSENDPVLSIPVSDGVQFAKLSTIIRCQAEGSYSRIYFENGDELLIAKTLKAIKDLVKSEKLMRIHQSHLVNVDHINKYIKSDGGQVILSNGSNIPIARRRKEDWTNWLK